MNILTRPSPRNQTRHPVVDPRGNVLYIQAGVADRYWLDIEEGKGNIVVSERDVSHLLNDRDLPRDADARAKLEAMIDPHRGEIEARKRRAVKHDEEAQSKNARPARTEDVMRGLAAMAKANAPDVSAELLAAVNMLREQNAAMAAKLEALEAAKAAPKVVAK